MSMATAPSRVHLRGGPAGQELDEQAFEEALRISLGQAEAHGGASKGSEAWQELQLRRVGAHIPPTRLFTRARAPKSARAQVTLHT